MGYEFEQWEIDEDTEVTVDPDTLTIEEADWLRQNGVLRIRSHQTATGKVNEMALDAKKLSQIAFEFDTLKDVASSVEIEILEEFRRRDDRTLTTSELTDSTGRPKSSVSRALSRLTEKGKLSKVQAGVYRY